jgi:type IV pilus assembly protein PilP
VVWSVLSSAVVAVALVLSGCSDSKPVPVRMAQAIPKRVAPTPPPAAVQPKQTEDDNYRYDPTGKPDPFRSYVKVFLSRQKNRESPATPLERFDLSQLRVTAVIWGSERPRALVNDPSGKGYIISVGAPIGKNQGRVIRIDDNLVLVKETYVDFRGQATTKDIEMRLHPSQGG